MAYFAEGAFSKRREEMEITIPVPWGHIAGKAWNDTNGVRILFVHGLQDNAGSFDTLIPLLPDTYYCIAIDLPGHGKSSHLPKGLPLKFFDFLIAVNRTVDFLGWDKFIYVGHSLGGTIGLCFSSVFNDRVSKLLILDSVFFGMATDSCVHNIVTAHRELKRIEEQIQFGKAPEYSYKAAVQRLMEGRPDPISETTAKILAKRSLVKHGSGYRFSMDQRLKAYERHRLSHDQLTQVITRIKCPILHIMTSETCRLSDQMDDFELIRTTLQKILRDSYRYHVIDGYHSVHIDFPERVKHLIVKFLANTECKL